MKTHENESSVLHMSPRAYSLVLRNNVDILKIVPTGPDGTIIENDILRAIEERSKQEEDARLAKEVSLHQQSAEIEQIPEQTAPVESLEEPTEEPISEEEALLQTLEEVLDRENFAEILIEDAEALETEETAESDNTAEEEIEDEISVEIEIDMDDIDESEEAIDELNALEPIEGNTLEEATEEEEALEETDSTEALTEEQEECLEEESAESEEEPAEAEEAQETAIVTAPVHAIANEETKAEEKEEIKAEKPFRSEDAYRHTDVIIPASEKAPDAAPVTIEMSFDATALVTLRGKIKENGEAMGIPAVTINDMILFAVTKTLKKHKAMNAHFLGDKIRYFDGIHLGFLVDTDRGPETLTVFDADRLSLSSLSKITGALVRGVRAGGEAPEKNQRMGSFTVTNVGTLGVERFIPRLLAPQTGALAVSALSERIKLENGETVSYPAIPLALTFDPRAMSTANAAKFLRELCLALENFGLILIK